MLVDVDDDDSYLLTNKVNLKLSNRLTDFISVNNHSLCSLEWIRLRYIYKNIVNIIYIEYTLNITYIDFNIHNSSL